MSNLLLSGPMRTIQVTMPIKLIAAIDRVARKKKISRAKLLRDFSITGLEEEKKLERKAAGEKPASLRTGS